MVSANVEMSFKNNHLGNVRGVVSDLKTAVQDGDELKNDADVLAYYNYYPFGLQMHGRYNPTDPVGNGGYRFGFQGEEKDDEISGSTGTHYAFKYRMYDARIGKFFSVDPLVKKYPYWSPYAFSGNRVIDMVELEGLEPAEPGSSDGQYSIAAKQGSNDFFGWTWNTKDKNWLQGSSTQYSRGNASTNSPDDDLTKTFHPGQDVNTRNTAFTDSKGNRIEGLTATHLDRFRTAYNLGTSLERTNEEDILLNNFINGNNGVQTFGTNSFMAGLISQDDGFVNFAQKFEAAALSYFNANGNLEGFGGNQTLQGLGALSITDTWFMHTVMGGTQQVNAQIRSISANEIQVNYMIWDHFGAGRNDAGSRLPGLPSMYWLQHNSTTYDRNTSNQFTPFIWNVEVER